MKPIAVACALFIITLISSCGPFRYIAKEAQKNIIKQNGIATAHAGISIYEPATNKYWFNYQDDKYFVPASNVKIATCYAAMKYLGDSLEGIRYLETDSSVIIAGTGDPTLLHPDFEKHNVFDFLKNTTKRIEMLYKPWQFQPLGKGWSWDDYNDDYMVERSEIPVFGNVVKIKLEEGKLNVFPSLHNIVLFPLKDTANKRFRLVRDKDHNRIKILPSSKEFSEATIPLTDVETIRRPMLWDAFKKVFEISKLDALPQNANVIHSQPTDSLLKPMMYRSDNFFAEQSLLMVSNELLGSMNDERIIDTLLKTDFKELPQKPRWVDGCGLSRYNLFTPRDFVYLLNKMKDDFGMERIKSIFPTGGKGTLSNYFEKDAGYIFAKTGSLSGIVTLSGYLYTRKNKLLLFSVLINNHQTSATGIRRAVEKFLQSVRDKY